MWSTGVVQVSRSFPVRSLAVALVAAAMLAACGVDSSGGGGAEETIVECSVVTDGETPIEGVVVEHCESNLHVSNPVYTADPPSGGEHLAPPQWQNCGVYDEAVPEGSAVHSLEHGAVWIAYQPDLPDADVAVLTELATSHGDRIILSPYPGLPAPVVIVAWERRLELDAADDPRLIEFYNEFVNGSQAPEPAAACRGGVGEPIG